LITKKILRGDLHSHTTASDGKNSILQMAEAAKASATKISPSPITPRAVSSPTASPPTAFSAHCEIRQAQTRSKHHAPRRKRVDILADAASTMRKQFSNSSISSSPAPHASLKQEPTRPPIALRRAIESRYVNIIGHPPAADRRREGLPWIFPPLFKAAASTGTAMEINAGYPRLDLTNSTPAPPAKPALMNLIDTDATARRAMCDPNSA